MSLTTSLTQHGMTVLAADGGLLDLINDKSNEATTTLRNIAIAAGTALALWLAWRAKGALGAVITGGLIAALLIYMVTHVDDLGNRVNNEINGSAVQAPAAAVSSPTPDSVIAPPIL